MKAKLIRPLLRPCKTTAEKKAFSKKGFPTCPAGTVIDHADAHWLVKMGHAVPHDAECAAAAGMTDEEMAAAQHAADRVVKGIHPDDFGDFDAGKMIGYDAKGKNIPGPNADPEPVESLLETEPSDAIVSG